MKTLAKKKNLKKMYMTDFNESCLKDADSVTKTLKEIFTRIRGS